MNRLGTISLAVTAMVCGGVHAASAQTTGPVPCTARFTEVYCQVLNDYYNQAQGAPLLPSGNARIRLETQAQANLDNLADPGKLGRLFASAFAPTPQELVSTLANNAAASFADTAQLWDQKRLDRDGSVPAAASSSTDLVARAGVSEFLSAALGVGAFSQTVSGNTGTIHVNAGGLKSYLQSGAILAAPPTMSEDATNLKPIRLGLRNLDLSASFDLNTATTAAMATTGVANPATPNVTSVLVPSSANRWSGVTARYAVKAPLDPNSINFRKAWLTATKRQQVVLIAAANAMLTAIEQADPGISTAPERALQDQYAPMLEADQKDKSPGLLAQHFEAYCESLLALFLGEHPQFSQSANAARLSSHTFQEIVQETVNAAEDVQGYPLLLEYDYYRPVSQPATHVARLVASRKSGLALYTFNGAATLYDGTIPAGSSYGRFRDVQASGQIDRGLGANNLAILSGAVYYQYQKDPTVLNITSGNLAPGTSITLPSNAQVLLGTAGSTVIGQLKATINLKSGLKIPFAFKWASRTNLIDSQEKIGQVGLTYDFSSFASLFGAKAQTP